MQHIPVLKLVDAPSEVRSVYEEFHRRMDFPSAPNFIMTQGHSASVARGTWDVVRNVLVVGQIERWVKELMFVAISKDRGCRYCTAAHIACCRMLGVSAELLDDLIADVTSLSDLRVREIVLFGVKCARDPQSLTEVDYEVLRRRGLTRSEILEVVAMSALAVYANIIADATAMEPDEIFSKL